MATQIIADNKDPTYDLLQRYAAILANFAQRMTLRKAEEEYSLTHGELRAAVEQGKIRYYKVGKSEQYRVSPQFVAEYIERYRTFQNDPLPS